MTKSSTNTPATASHERELLEAGRQLSAALARYRDTVLEIYSQPGPIIELDETMDKMLGTAGALDVELNDLQRAIELIETDAPIAELSSRGHRWKGALSPKWLLYFAGLGRAGDPGYRGQLERVTARDEERAAERLCGRPTAKGEPCRAVAALWPGRAQDSACTRHLSSDEKVEVDASWVQAVDAHDCPGCAAPAGAPCEADPAGALRVVDGEWPRVRQFNGRMVHEPRLRLDG